jgi:hypothetical protein
LLLNEEKAMAKHFFNRNVIHGEKDKGRKHFAKGDLCPDELVGDMSAKGFVEEWIEPKAPTASQLNPSRQPGGPQNPTVSERKGK